MRIELSSTGLPEMVAADLAVASADIARQFAGGATLWICAPDWPAHARDMAVEFVHPVSADKVSLPAVAVDSHNVVETLRTGASPGDMFVAVSDSSNHVVRATMARAPIWGMRTIWLGAGKRPDAGAADHVLWLDDSVVESAYGGGFVLAYHLLWELTHVCFEHPGLLELAAGQADSCSDGEDVCVTCADEGTLGEVVAVGAREESSVRTARGIELVDTSLIGSHCPGDLVLIHAGSAIALLPD